MSESSLPLSPTYPVVDAAITSRKSIRAFKPDPVPRDVIEDILRVAGRAPSGTNVQPWKITVLTGEPLQRLSQRILAAFDDDTERAAHTEEYDYYPLKWTSPYVDRRRKLGWELYGLLGITRDDKAGMHHQHGRNYRYFDAPVGLIVTIDRIMAQGSWLDTGMFLQSIMVAARARGLATCPQAAFNQFHRIIEAELGVPETEMVVCGMALGWADMSKVENTLPVDRMALSEFVRFLG